MPAKAAIRARPRGVSCVAILCTVRGAPAASVRQIPGNPPEDQMTVTDELLQHAARYAAGFRHGDLRKAPARKLAVVACMDARLDPYALLGLAEGDAHVIRNAGGAITADALRSLAISQRALGTEAIVLIHHTDCGMHGFDHDRFGAAARSGDRRAALVVGRRLHRSRRRRPPVARAGQGLPVPSAPRRRARLRLRRRHGRAARGRAERPQRPSQSENAGPVRIASGPGSAPPFA